MVVSLFILRLRCVSRKLVESVSLLGEADVVKHVVVAILLLGVLGCEQQPKYQQSGGPNAPAGQPTPPAEIPQEEPVSQSACEVALSHVEPMKTDLEAVSAASYEPTEKTCNEKTAHWDGVYDAVVAAGWPVTGGDAKDVAIRNWIVGNTQVLLWYACDGQKKVVADHGEEGAKGLVEQFNKNNQQLRAACQ